MIRLFSLILILFTFGCTQIAGGTAVYAIGKYSEKKAKYNRTYTKLSKCMDNSKPSAYVLAESIAYGEPITAKYDNILSDLVNPHGGPVEPHQLAYAFYYIAMRIGDKRGFERIKWLKQYANVDKEAQEIEEVIKAKYLTSYLKKCFSVPEQYKIERTIRDVILNRGSHE